jgi:hypothetical protein
MSKRRQHYVPKLYLRGFQSEPRRINLYHLASRDAVKDASLRDQCYIHKFYGPSPEIEDSLASLEDVAAPVIRAICESGKPPAPGTEQHSVLLSFVGLQILRTPVARQNIKDSWVKMDAQIFGDSEPSPESGLARFSPVPDNEALALQMKIVPQYVEALADLHVHVARTGIREGLITSDNPVFKYNTYCRGIRYLGVTGAHSRGLQIFLPLSPRILLLLYDAAVYAVSEDRSTQSTYGSISREDVERLNAAQIINAEECVYFADWYSSESIDRLARAHLPFKQSDIMHVDEGKLAGSEDSTIVHLWEKQPELPFSLPLSRLRLHAQRTPLKDRANTYRYNSNV